MLEEHWRNLLISNLLRIKGSSILANIDFIKKVERKPVQFLRQHQKQKIAALLAFSRRNVPYYDEVIRNSKVTIKPDMNLEELNKLPIRNKALLFMTQCISGIRLYVKF
jgi:phenylacetate-coenzyme A ligase PaaK-like adenylate-forming protein